MPAVGQALLGVAERIADELAGTRELLRHAQRIAEELTEAFERPEKLAWCADSLHEIGVSVPLQTGGPRDAGEWRAVAWLAFLPLFAEVPPPRFIPDGYHRADLVRDIFGNPFQAVVFDPAWRTETTLGLARRMYDGRAFGPMPILADALEDAGCHTAEVLAHCRGGGPHVRGCWVVDHLIGQS
jgi:hypothetical protein